MSKKDRWDVALGGWADSCFIELTIPPGRSPGSLAEALGRVVRWVAADNRLTSASRAYVASVALWLDCMDHPYAGPQLPVYVNASIEHLSYLCELFALNCVAQVSRNSRDGSATGSALPFFYEETTRFITDLLATDDGPHDQELRDLAAKTMIDLLLDREETV